MAKADSEGLSLGYRILYRIRYVGLHVFGPAQLGDAEDPHARMRRERGAQGRPPRVERGPDPLNLQLTGQRSAFADARSFAFWSASTSLGLGHPGPPLDAEPAGRLVEVLLARVGVDAAGGRRGRVAGAVLLGAGVGRSVLVLGLPVVAHLLVGVLQGGERRLVRASLVVVLRHRRVERLRERLLRLAARALQSARRLVLLGLAALGGLRHPSSLARHLHPRDPCDTPSGLTGTRCADPTAPSADRAR